MLFLITNCDAWAGGVLYNVCNRWVVDIRCRDHTWFDTAAAEEAWWCSAEWNHFDSVTQSDVQAVSRRCSGLLCWRCMVFIEVISCLSSITQYCISLSSYQRSVGSNMPDCNAYYYSVNMTLLPIAYFDSPFWPLDLDDKIE